MTRGHRAKPPKLLVLGGLNASTEVDPEPDHQPCKHQGTVQGSRVLVHPGANSISAASKSFCMWHLWSFMLHFQPAHLLLFLNIKIPQKATVEASDILKSFVLMCSSHFLLAACGTSQDTELFQQRMSPGSHCTGARSTGSTRLSYFLPHTCSQEI